MKHILPIRGPNPKIFYFLIALCFVAICVPANATIAAPDFSPNLTAFHNYDLALNSATTRAGNTDTVQEGVALARNSVWRFARINAADEKSRTYMNTTTDASAIIPRKIPIPLLA